MLYGQDHFPEDKAFQLNCLDPQKERILTSREEEKRVLQLEEKKWQVQRHEDRSGRWVHQMVERRNQEVKEVAGTR